MPYVKEQRYVLNTLISSWKGIYEEKQIILLLAIKV